MVAFGRILHISLREDDLGSRGGALAVFSLVVGRPKMPGIIIGMDWKYSTAVACSWLVMLVSRCIVFGFRQAQDALHHGRYGPEG